jgi:spore maturation protein CgeB
MAREGFLSNRLFDAVASGAAVVSDPAAGLTEVFSDCVSMYHSAEELPAVLERSLTMTSADRLNCAKHIAEEHSFVERARVMVEHVNALRGVG